jgi:hypothetical protein
MCGALAAIRPRASSRYHGAPAVLAMPDHAAHIPSFRDGRAKVPTNPCEGRPDLRLAPHDVETSVPTPAAVPPAAQQQDDKNDDEKRGGIHVCLLPRYNSSFNRMLWNAAPFRMRHRGRNAIRASAKDERPLRATARCAGRQARCGLRWRPSGLRASRPTRPDPRAVFGG